MTETEAIQNATHYRLRPGTVGEVQYPCGCYTLTYGPVFVRCGKPGLTATHKPDEKLVERYRAEWLKK